MRHLPPERYWEPGRPWREPVLLRAIGTGLSILGLIGIALAMVTYGHLWR